jgi:TonB-dependent receptor
MFLLSAIAAGQQPAGALRGSVWDQDFDVPITGATVTIVETVQSAQTNDQGSYVIENVQPGRYTVVVTKDGYQKQVRADVVVEPGQLTDLDVRLAGEFTEMDEFIVQNVLAFGGASEQSLLALRFASPALMDSIGADLMSRAGASDAASALKLVAGASLAGGKYAVIRGMPDRYVSNQMNGVRLPTADENKRAVELDQFPAPVIESLQVSKTFTPDQQGDASGGAVNVKLRGVPEENFVQATAQVGGNTNTTLKDDFLTYKGGGTNYLGQDEKAQQLDKLGQNWDGSVGVSEGTAPIDDKWSLSAGGKQEISDGVKIGALASLFHEHKTTGFDDGVNNSLWVENPGDKLTPQYFQGTPSQGTFKTAMFDVKQGTESVKLGGLAAFGIESERNRLTLSYLYTHAADDTATLAEDTRGKAFFFPGYDPHDITDPGNQKGTQFAAPYLRTETLSYTERTTSTLQLDGEHKLPLGGWSMGVFDFKDPELDWNLSTNAARLDQPDKRQFGTLMAPEYLDPGVPFLGIPPHVVPSTWYPYKPSENINFGNLQRIWKSIDETSDQYSLNMKLPFEQWSGNEGYLKVGAFSDDVQRHFNQDTFSNLGDSGDTFVGGFNDFWSNVFPHEPDHPITASQSDVDYDGTQKVKAWYSMLDMPLDSKWSVLGGARVEQTDITVVNHAEPFATWIPPGESAPQTLTPGAADVDFHQKDVLPAAGLVFAPVEEVTLRASYSQTVARQTFKELTPILQQEYVGAPIFIGNPDLQMSALTNYDLRADYVPYEGSLLSASWFKKDIKDPIEYIQKPVDPVFTTAVNYPKGTLDGIELEARQQLGHYADPLQGFGVGANATFINSDVTLPADEAAQFAAPGIDVHLTHRDMTNAPDHLFNLYLTYDTADAQSQFALFYTVTGDALVAGAGQANGHFVPNVYATQYGTLNFSAMHHLSERTTLKFEAKNLTNPQIQEVYRADGIPDAVKTSYTKGREFTLGVSIRF